MFGLFINDLDNALKGNTKWIDLETSVIQCLLYAEEDVVHDCYEKWCVRVNVNKSKVTHFRTVGLDTIKVWDIKHTQKSFTQVYSNFRSLIRIMGVYKARNNQYCSI